MLSGNGTTMSSLLFHSRLPGCPYEIVLVASNQPEARGLKIAAAEGIATFAHSHKGMDREAHEALIDAALREAGAEYIALCGYMRVLTAGFVDGWAGRMLNTHPSLLPKYKGLHTHERAIEAGDSARRLLGARGHRRARRRAAARPGGGAHPARRHARHAVGARADGRVPALPADARRLRRAREVARVARPRKCASARSRCPRPTEVGSHGMPCFGIEKGKKFAYVSLDHHGDGKTGLLVKISGPDEQAQLIDMDEERYYRPAYFGDGWVGIRLDLGDTDWDAIGEWLRRSWQPVAPRRLQILGEF